MESESKFTPGAQLGMNSPVCAKPLPAHGVANAVGHGFDDDFAYIRDVVYKLSRISLGPQKKMLVISRVAKRMRDLKCANLGEYCDLLRRPSGRSELSELIDAISTNHTYFFRESAHFEFLTRRILEAPDRPREHSFKVWSAACATGEEPYSIAMVLEEQRLFERGFEWRMDATDISHHAVARAKAGEYPVSALERVPERLFRHMKQMPSGGYKIKDSICQRIRFFQMNLFAPAEPLGDCFDLILCRNVMIYFDAKTRSELTISLCRRLRAGGILYVGHSESLSGIDAPLVRVQPAIYQKQG